MSASAAIKIEATIPINSPAVTIGVQIGPRPVSVERPADAEQAPVIVQEVRRLKAQPVEAPVMTFRQAAEAYIETHKGTWRNVKHTEQWISTLEKWVYPAFGDRSVADIDIPAVLKVIETPVDGDTFWNARHETARRTLNRVEAVLGWAKKRGDIPVNPIENAPRIYHSNRAEKIWTKRDLIALLKGQSAEFRRAVLLAAFTGLRLGDLVELTWAEVGEDAMTVATNKSGETTIAVIPIIPKAKAILKQIGRKDLGCVLTHSRGEPWTEWGLQTAMQRAKTKAKLKGLTFHDLRGTAATHFIRGSLPPADVAGIMGWETERVQTIARRYVTAEAVAAGMLERLRKNRR